MSIEERISDALEAPDTEGTDIATVKQAMAAFDAGDMKKTRTLLETSIGAGPHLGEGLPPDVGETTGEPGQPSYVVGEATGTTIVFDELAPADFDAGDAVMLILSGLSIVAGLALALRYRPRGTVHQMRRTRVPKGLSDGTRTRSRCRRGRARERAAVTISASLPLYPWVVYASVRGR